MHKMKWVPKTKSPEQKGQKKDLVNLPAPSPSSRPEPQYKYPKPKQKEQKITQVHLPKLSPSSQSAPRHKHRKQAKKEDPLYAAVMANQPEEVKSLITQGADPHKHYGLMRETLLHVAARHNKKQAAVALIEMKANVNVNLTASGALPIYCSKGTPLHVAAGAKQIEIIDILIKAKAKVNLQDAKGDTPLHAAVYGSYNGSHQSTIETLLRAGADPTIKNKKELTPAALAIEWNESELAAALIKWEFPKEEDQLKALRQIARFTA